MSKKTILHFFRQFPTSAIALPYSKSCCMNKYFLTVLCLLTAAFVIGQVDTLQEPLPALSGANGTGPATVAGYSPAQKQLLVRSTAAFIQVLNQQSLDRDTVMLIACRITGVPFLLAWTEDPDSTTFSPGAQWINTNKIAQAIRLFKSAPGQVKTQLAIELATWYLHQPGARKKDLDSAQYFIRAALASKTGDRYIPLFLRAEYQRQSGHIDQSKKVYRRIIGSGNQNNISNAWFHLATLNQRVDSTDLPYINKALVGYQTTHTTCKEIECLYASALYHLRTDLSTCEHELQRILDLQRSMRFRHALFAQYQLCHVFVQQSDNIEAMAFADSAFANMKWADMTAMASTFYMRIGVAYGALGKNDNALAWYKKALEHPSRETELFWFKSLLNAAALLFDEEKWQEGLDLVTKMTDEFPPVTPWQKAQELVTKAEFYRDLHNDRLAEENQRAFLNLLDADPEIDHFGELNYDIKEIAAYYVARSDIKTAQLLLHKGMTASPHWINHDLNMEQLLYKIDSAEGRFNSAFNHYKRYKAYEEINTNLQQQAKFEEINVRFAAEKKDGQIKLLQRDQKLQTASLHQERATRNWILAVVALLLAIVGLLVWNSRLKQRANTYLRRLLDEKDWLVKEIHHRVKNNLHMISGLLETQASFVRTGEAVSAIRESQHRVNAMSLVHQKLYQTNSLYNTDMPAYINELVSYLEASMKSRPRIRFNLQIEKAQFDLTHTIPLSLILNEAVTNAIKYAFPEGRPGEITIVLQKRTDGQFLLSIADNGIGIPKTAMDHQFDSMGMSLMNGLSEDIGGAFSVQSDDGTTIEVVFPAPA